MDLSGYIQKADSIVTNHFKQYAATHHDVGVLLSGGIDSTLITSYVTHYFSHAILFSMGTTHTKDRPFVECATHHFKKTYEWIALDETTISDALPDVRSLLTHAHVEATPMQLSLAVGYYLIFKRAAAMGVTAMVTGQGPDIVFGGYHKYKGMKKEELEREIVHDLALLETDKRRDGAMAKRFGIILLNPYLEHDFVDFSLTVPGDLKIHNGIEKYFMREWGKVRQLPDEIVHRPKKAFQYSTGLQKVVQKVLQPIDK